MTKDILIVGSQHGNELLGIRLYEYLTEISPGLLSKVEYYCANPLAFSRDKRFIESDMNRSYGPDSTGYEARRAQMLADMIRVGNYGYIIDCHTTTTEVGACFIVKARNATVDAVINAVPEVSNIVLMKTDIADLSLLGVSDAVVAIEVNEKFATEESILDILLRMIERLSNGETVAPVKRAIYRVNKFIDPKEPVNEADLQNFKSHNGRYPVLCGGDAKKRTYKGFWATKQASVLI